MRGVFLKCPECDKLIMIENRHGNYCEEIKSTLSPNGCQNITVGNGVSNRFLLPPGFVPYLPIGCCPNYGFTNLVEEDTDVADEHGSFLNNLDPRIYALKKALLEKFQKEK